MEATPAAVFDSTDPDDLVVIVAPDEVCEDLPDEVACLRPRVGDSHGSRPRTERADVAQLTAEIERLERELERKQAHLDAVVARNEQILAERTRAYQAQLADPDARDGDDFLWHGRRQEWDGPLARASRWMRELRQ